MRLPFRVLRVIFATAGVLILLRAPAAAQQADPPRLTVGIGGGVANPMHGDFDFVAPEWQISVRGRVSGGVTVEGFFSQWRHSEERVFTNQQIPVPGLIGVFRIVSVTQRTVRTTRVVGVNALAGGTRGRVTWTAGGGAGIMDFRRDFVQVVGGCAPTSAEVCESGNALVESDLGLQAVAGLDVRIAPRVLGYGQFQLAFPTSDFGSGHVSVTGGVRIVLW